MIAVLDSKSYRADVDLGYRSVRDSPCFFGLGLAKRASFSISFCRDLERCWTAMMMRIGTGDPLRELPAIARLVQGIGMRFREHHVPRLQMRR